MKGVLGGVVRTCTLLTLSKLKKLTATSFNVFLSSLCARQWHLCDTVTKVLRVINEKTSVTGSCSWVQWLAAGTCSVPSLACPCMAFMMCEPNSFSMKCQVFLSLLQNEKQFCYPTPNFVSHFNPKAKTSVS